MADFKVQRGQATIPASTLSVTISAGTDYTAPASLTAAFIRVVGASYVGDATPYSQFAPELRETANIVDPTTLLTSVTFQRYDTTNTGALTIEWEIIEYVGAAGGANEMIVRHVEALNPAGGVDVIDTATVSGVVTDADVAVFVTSAAVDASDRLGLTEAEFTAAWVPASQYAELTRIGDNNHSSYVSVAVVEFTGSNWSVQRVEHTYAAVGVVETEPITAVPSLSQAFIHPQMRAAYGGGSSSMAQTAWLSAVDTVSFELDSTASTYSQVGVVWIISNTATGTGAMNVQRSGQLTRAAGGSDPDVWTGTITAVADLTQASVWGESAVAQYSATDSLHNHVGFELTAVDTVTATRGRSDYAMTYTFEVVEWPTAASGGGSTIAVGQATETSATQGIGILKTRSIAQPSESDAPLAFGAAKTLAIAEASETETAFGFSRTTLHAIGQALESDSALATLGAKLAALGLASTADLALALTALKTRSLAQPLESDSALVVSPVPMIVVNLGLALEADVAEPASWSKLKGVGVALESDLGLAARPDRLVALGMASELDTALALTAARILGAGESAEADLAFALTHSKLRALGPAAETDAAHGAAAVALFFRLNDVRKAIEAYFEAGYTETPIAWPNQDFAPPASADWARFNLAWGKGAEDTAGDRGANTIPGFVEVQLFTPAGAGVGPLVARADRIRALLDHIDLLNGVVRFGAAFGPVRTRGDSGWEQMNVRVPFETIESVDAAVAAAAFVWTPGEIDTLEAYQKTIEEYFEQEWAGQTEIKWPGANLVPPDGDWVSVEVVFDKAAGDVMEDAARNTIHGHVELHFHTKPGTGLGSLYSFVDDARALFTRKALVGGIQFMAPSGPIEAKKPGWRRMDVHAPFEVAEAIL